MSRKLLKELDTMTVPQLVWARLECKFTYYEGPALELPPPLPDATFDEIERQIDLRAWEDDYPAGKTVGWSRDRPADLLAASAVLSGRSVIQAHLEWGPLPQTAPCPFCARGLARVRVRGWAVVCLTCGQEIAGKSFRAAVRKWNELADVMS